jgi:leucyl aminopeptidase
MKFNILKKGASGPDGSLLVIFSTEGTSAISQALKMQQLPADLQTDILSQMNLRNFNAKAATTISFFTGGRFKASNIVIAGLGKKNELTKFSASKASALAASAAREVKARNVSVAIGGISKKFIREITEGFLLGDYRFGKYKTRDEDSDNQPFIEEITYTIEGEITEKIKKDVFEGALLAEATCKARDLVNTPAADATPSDLATEAARVAKDAKLHISIWNLEEIKKNGLGCIVAVSKGSAEAPKFITVEYSPPKKTKKHIVYVGKGVTFDSGGISLKPPRGMHTMKGDMAGAATVLYAIETIARMKLPVRVTVLIPVVENMPGGKALKPGDVIRAKNGRTIEIISTDAEGRLILADALVLASEKKPDVIVELSTLTGGAAYCCGEMYSLVMGTNPKTINAIKNASKVAGEHIWELPIVEEYKKGYTSGIADLNNQGKGKAQTILGAIFLREFVDEKIPFAHIDIAASSFTDEGDMLCPIGGTGAMVRTLVEFVRKF